MSVYTENKIQITHLQITYCSELINGYPHTRQCYLKTGHYTSDKAIDLLQC